MSLSTVTEWDSLGVVAHSFFALFYRPLVHPTILCTDNRIYRRTTAASGLNNVEV